MVDEVKDRRLRMLWHSNSVFTTSGYGVHQRDILYRFLKDGWPTAQSVNCGVEVAPITLEGLLIYPKLQDPFGADAMLMHGRHFNANAVFSMQDVWTLNPQFLQQIKCWIPYTPIDKSPAPINVVNILKFSYKIVTFSKFGHDTLEKEGYASTLIPEGTDTEIFKPLDKMEMRDFFHIPRDMFIFGMVGANKPDPIPRKGWQQALDAFKLFHDKYPKSGLFFQSNQPGGFPVEEYANYLGIAKSLFFMDQYMAWIHTGSEVINKMLNAFDVLLHPSTTEGFGLVVIESQAAGTPVIVNNCTSMPELIIEGKTGEMSETMMDMWAPGGGYISFANPKSLFEKMEVMYKKVQENDVQISKDCREHIVKNYNVDMIVKEKWFPFLEKLQIELLGPLVDKKIETT